MRKKLLLCIGFLLFASCPLFFAGHVEAAYLKFGSTSVSATANQTFTVDVIVDAGTDLITSTDIWVTFDPAYLQAQTVTPGAFFPAVTNNITSGSVSITGLIVDPATYRTGVGTVATITFKALKNGTSTLGFDCRSEVSNTSKIIKNDINATNIIVCTQNVSTTVTIGTGGTTSSQSSTITAAPSVVPTTPSSLPKTGVAENIAKFAAPGIMLLLIGGILRFILN